MIRLDIRPLGPEKKAIHWDEKAAVVGLEAESAFRHPLSIDVMARRIADRVIVEGSVKSRVAVECSRCLENFEMPLEAQVAIEYREGQAPAEDSGRDKVLEDEVDVNWFEPPYIEMGEDLRQILLLEVPAYPVCREECRGLCPTCGANRNNMACGCGNGVERTAFQELGEVLKKKRRNK